MKIILLLAMAATFSFGANVKLQEALDRAARETRAEFELKPAELAVTVVDLRSPTSEMAMASIRGDARIYPASVVKLFYLEAAHRWMEEGRIIDTPEVRRALRYMIV